MSAAFVAAPFVLAAVYGLTGIDLARYVTRGRIVIGPSRRSLPRGDNQ